MDKRFFLGFVLSNTEYSSVGTKYSFLKRFSAFQ